MAPVSHRSRPPVSDVILVAFSVVLSLTVWLIVTQRESVTDTVFMPLTVVTGTLHPAVELDRPPHQPDLVGVEINYPKAQERYVKASAFTIEVDLRELFEQASPQAFSDIPVRLTLDQVVKPQGLDGVRVIQFVTGGGGVSSSMTVTYRARLRTAAVRVSPAFAGAPPTGFEVEQDRIVLDPPGPFLVAVDEQRLRASAGQPISLPTEPIALPVETNRLFSVPYADPEKRMYADGVYAIPEKPIPRLDIVVPLRELQGEARFLGIPFRYEPFERADLKAEIRPEQFDVRISGPLNLVDKVTTDSLRLYTDAWIDETPGTTVTVSIDVAIDEASEAVRQRLSEIRREVIPRNVTITLTQDPDAAPAAQGTEVPPPDAPAPAPATTILPAGS